MNKKMIFTTHIQKPAIWQISFISTPSSTIVESIPTWYFYLFFSFAFIVLFVGLLFNKPPTKKQRVNPSPARDSEPEDPSDPPSHDALRFLSVVLASLWETLDSCEDSCDGSLDTNAAISTNSDGSGEASNCSADTDAPVVPEVEVEVPAEVGGSRTVIEEINSSITNIEGDK